MSTSQAWIEWHLTPRGWETADNPSGPAEHTESTPTDRVLTCHYLEENADFMDDSRRSLKVIWHCGDIELIGELVLRYGNCPPPSASFRHVDQTMSYGSALANKND